MTVEIDIDVEGRPVIALPVPLTATDVTIIQAPCTLVGWSLRNANGEIPVVGEGSVTSPAAGATIATTPSIAAGNHLVKWTVELGGTVAAADSNNFELVDSAGVVLVSVNPAVAGNYPQPDVEIAPTVSGPVTVKAIALGTVGAIYSASISVEVDETSAALVEFQDGNQPLGESAMQALEVDTHLMPGNGIKVHQHVLLHMLTGTVTGAVYVRLYG